MQNRINRKIEKHERSPELKKKEVCVQQTKRKLELWEKKRENKVRLQGSKSGTLFSNGAPNTN